MQFWWKIQFSK